MSGDRYCFEPIGLIHTPFLAKAGTPIQGVYAPQVRGTVEVFPAFEAGLDDVEGFSHLFLIYVFDRSEGYDLKCRPFRDDTERGVFAIRGPRRPNPIGLSVVRLLARQGNLLQVAEMDVLDGTPLLDIKPYVPDFDCREGARSGWLHTASERRTADGRFDR